MNVEILCSSRELFGADRSALRLAEALRSLDLSPVLVLPANRPELGLSQAAHDRGIPSREVPLAIVSSSGVEAPLALLPFRRASSVDVTIVNSTAVVGSSTRTAKKVVVVREWLDPGSKRHRLVAARHRLGATAVVGVSSDVISQWGRCVGGPSRRYVVHNWLERSFLDSTAGARGRDAREGILCIGRFNRWKGQDALADAYEQAFGDRDDRPLLRFVGAQPGTTFDARAKELGERGARFGWEVHPFTSDPSDHFSAAALVVVPSLQPEPFGTVVLEALAHGCRVLAFEGGGPSDMAESFPSALEVIPRSTAQLAKALEEWWDDGGSPLSADERLQARSTLESSYSPEAAATSWHAIMADISPATFSLEVSR